MGHPIRKLEETYKQIVQFYDLAEEMIDTVEAKETKDPASQLAFIEPLVLKIEQSTDTLAEEFRHFVATGKKPNFFSKRRIEKSLNTIYDALNHFKRNQEKGR